MVLGPRPMTPEDFQNRLYTFLRTSLTSVVYLKYKYGLVKIFAYAELGTCVGDCCLKKNNIILGPVHTNAFSKTSVFCFLKTDKKFFAHTSVFAAF